MSDLVVDRFIEALATLESQSDVEPIATLFASGAEVGNVLAPEKFHGPDGARDFWTKYRETFATIRSTFRNQIVDGTRAALEWSTEATAANENQVRYDGVSILEFTEDRITRFRAYFDPLALGRQIEPPKG